MLIALRRVFFIAAAWFISTVTFSFGFCAFTAQFNRHPLNTFLQFAFYWLTISLAISLLGSGPGLLAIAVGEWLRIKSIWYYNLIGSVSALIVVQVASMPSSFTLLVCLVSGLVAATAYWFLAGRNAGLLAETQTPTAQKYVVRILGLVSALCICPIVFAKFFVLF
jgi:hypothetical protein